MRSVLRIDSETVTVEPGIIRDELNRELHKTGRYFPPDPSNANVTTIGSMLAVDAAGSRSVRVGSTRDHVVSIDVVTSGGQFFTAENESLDILKTPLPPLPAGASLFDLGVASSEDSDANFRRQKERSSANWPKCCPTIASSSSNGSCP